MAPLADGGTLAQSISTKTPDFHGHETYLAECQDDVIGSVFCDVDHIPFMVRISPYLAITTPMAIAFLASPFPVNAHEV
jgi:hypothetical protein